MLSRRAFAASALAYVAVTCVIGREVLASLGTRVASDPGDPVLNTAILAWNAMRVPWTDAWYQFPIFHPTPDALTLSEHLLGVSVITSPIAWATADPLVAYNLTLLLTYPLSGLAMYALVWRLTRSPAAAFLAGLAFAFAPYRAAQLPHLQMLAVFWAPLALLGLHAFLDASVRLKPDTTREVRRVPLQPDHATDVRSVRLQPDHRWRWLAFFAVCWMLQGAANGYYLVYFSVLVGLWVLWFLAAQRQRRWRDVALVAAAAAIASIPHVPILYRYLQVHRELGLSRSLGEIAAFGADIAAPLCAPSVLTFWGWVKVACEQEGELFVGTGLAALCVAGAWCGVRGAGCEVRGAGFGVRRAGIRVWARRIAVVVALAYIAIALSVVTLGPWRIDVGPLGASASSIDKPLSTALAFLLIATLLSRRFHRVVRQGSMAAFYLLAALVCWVLSWGPMPRLAGVDVLYQAPFAWLMQLPGVGGLRVPARFWMMTVLCLVVFMGIVVARLLAGRSRRATALIVTAAACALLIDGWLTIPTAAMPPRPPDSLIPRAAAVLSLPLGDPARDVGDVYGAVVGGWRSVNGFSGYAPSYHEALRTLSEAHDEVLFEPFRRSDDLYVAVDAGNTAERAFIERQAGASVIGRREGMVVYFLPQREGSTRLLPPGGQRLTLQRLEASCGAEALAFAVDGDLETAWVCGPQLGDERLTADLGASRTTGAVVHAVGTAGAGFPRHLVVETSIDGETWAPAWEGSPARLVLLAAVDAPGATRVVLPFTPREARYVRLRQTGRHETAYWVMAELEIWSGGP